MADLLIVDDDLDLAELLAEVLAQEGHEVRVAHDGEDGLARLTERRPDVVLLDVEMPQLDGPGMAYRMVVHDCGLEEIPIVLASGVADLREVASRVGTPYYLAKPFQLSALFRVLNLALEERRAPGATEGRGGQVLMSHESS
ncbi:MAG: response regulator [Deltaproteobacteria bacterium]|nr:response regulator [Deltaproteobacteria bacterium]